MDPPQNKNPHKRKPSWVHEIIQGAERYGASKETLEGRKRTRSCSSYVALLCDIIDKEPSNYEEAVERKELFVFLTYLLVFLLKFRSGELVGCGIKFRIQRVPTRHTFDGLRYPKTRNT